MNFCPIRNLVEHRSVSCIFQTMKSRFSSALLLIATLLLLTACARAQQTDDKAEGAPPSFSGFEIDARPLDRSALHASYAPVLEQVRPAVVSVTSARVVRIMRGGPQNPLEELLRRFYGMPQVPQSRGELEERKLPNGLGSGVIVSADGYILTNNHVVSDESGEVADEIMVRLNDEREFSAKIVGRDPKTDVALLKVEASALPYVKLADSDSILVGDVVFAIGNPMGVGQTVTMGIVSATGRTDLGILGSQGYENFIQTDASINPGNSGGALVDTMGRLIGINTAIISPSRGNIGIGFAVPSNLVARVAESLVTTGTVQRGFLGVNIATLTPDLAEAFGLPQGTKGVIIEGVQTGEAAEAAGLKRGDVILRVNGTIADNVSTLRLRISQTPPGQTIKLDVWRDNQEQSFEITLGALEGSLAATTGEGFIEGVNIAELTPELREQYGIPEGEKGVVITRVEARSPYASTLREGMVILEINDRPSHTIREAASALRKGNAVNKLWVAFNGNRGFIAVRVK